MIAEHEYHNARAWFEGCRRPLLVAHRRPDGDALGALAALSIALRHLGHEPLPTLFEEFPTRYTLLRDATQWHDWDTERAELTQRCDAVVILDTCARSQLETIADWLPNAPRTLVIDHHPTRDDIGTRPGDLRLIDERAAAVCLPVAELLLAAGVPFSQPIATALFTGLATDSGWFQFPSTDSRTLRIAATLVDAGATPYRIYSALHERDPAARLRLIGRLLQSLELLADGRLAVLTLRQADFAAAGADQSMTEDLVNEAKRLSGTEATVMFTEEPNGRVRVNLRSKNTLDVAALASRFGGGGHARAAGARPDGTWDDVYRDVVAAVTEALGPPA